MITEILKTYPFIVLDGAFSTELERQGFSINDDLWSAIALYKNPDMVKAVHLSYYRAGSDIVTSASYQATLQGFEKKGFTRDEGKKLLRKSVELVQEARDEYLSSAPEEKRPAPSWLRPSVLMGHIWQMAASTKGTMERLERSWQISTGSGCRYWRKRGRISLPVKPFLPWWRPWRRRMCCPKFPVPPVGFPSPAKMNSIPVVTTLSEIVRKPSMNFPR